MERADTIDDVVAILEGIEAAERRRGGALALFPAMYRRVTLRVKSGIDRGEFDDGPRMDVLDAVFANRYLDAYFAHRRGSPVTESWKVAFEGAESRSSSILQNLFVQMNAHILLDLGAAVAEVVPKEALPGFESDFLHIQTCLVELLDPVQDVVDRFSPFMALVDVLGGRSDEHFASFGIHAARALAWRRAHQLAASPSTSRDEVVRRHDHETALVGRELLAPPFPLGPCLRVVRARERAPLANVASALGRVEPRPSLDGRSA